MIDVFLLLGTNLGEREMYLQQAVQHIAEEVGAVIKLSSVYETQSWGKTDEPDYLNQVILLQTELPPLALLTRVLHIESILGRVRKERWGARVIDIDVLFYGDQVINEPQLQVPHPRLHERRFTLEPLAEIAPELIHPVLNNNVLSIKNALKDTLIVKKL
ncbi:2-amino-4-hydroxy-6-hydroxymethyldihydropteridine diphosphokinase [Mucilaginibacter gynuensis]|uniref:2-amino-4-hydroxy-6-hydroxymethyldihydropteridine pyrophosphokinase n=1 Tax=Mucilaginibacter gynuensis TaxID=1302236 RepID=A0ABP8HK58_9SPHI